MNKYDTQIELNKKTSLTYIISHIKSGASVLEFGSATGYMTKYLKEEKKCKVSIIEIDEEAYGKALEYAQNGICCDVEEMAWVDKFKGEEFDYITFADVLEHLRGPVPVLKACLPLLKEGGRILASVPNIAHNAVLIDLYNNKFEYRETGIMDNTHLRFYTHDSLYKLFEQCELYIEDEDAIVFDLEYAGLGNAKEDVPEDLWKEMYGRKYGFVNQFLFTLAKEATKQKGFFDDVRKFNASLYYITDQEGGEYDEMHKIRAELECREGKFFVEFDLTYIQEKVKKMCFAPFTDYCIIESVKAESDRGELLLNPMGGSPVEGGIGFFMCYPKYEVATEEEASIVKISFKGRIRSIQQGELRAYISKEQEIVNCEIYRLNQEIGRLNEVIEDKLCIIHEMSDTITANNQETERLNRVIEDKLCIIHEMSDTITANNQEIERLNRAIAELV